MKVEIATKSIDKIKGIEEAFFRYLKTEKIEFSSYKVESGVSEQPFNAETYKGAFNRVNNLIDKVDDADFYISCEAGIEEFFGKYMNVQVVCIFDRKNKVYLWGKSSGWCIPDSDVEKIKKNTLDKYLRNKGINSIEELFGNSYSRAQVISQAVELALASRKLL